MVEFTNQEYCQPLRGRFVHMGTCEHYDGWKNECKLMHRDLAPPITFDEFCEKAKRCCPGDIIRIITTAIIKRKFRDLFEESPEAIPGIIFNVRQQVALYFPFRSPTLRSFLSLVSKIAYSKIIEHLKKNGKFHEKKCRNCCYRTGYKGKYTCNNNHHQVDIKKDTCRDFEPDAEKLKNVVDINTGSQPDHGKCEYCMFLDTRNAPHIYKCSKPFHRIELKGRCHAHTALQFTHDLSGQVMASLPSDQKKNEYINDSIKLLNQRITHGKTGRIRQRYHLQKLLFIDCVSYVMAYEEFSLKETINIGLLGMAADKWNLSRASITTYLRAIAIYFALHERYNDHNCPIFEHELPENLPEAVIIYMQTVHKNFLICCNDIEKKQKIPINERVAQMTKKDERSVEQLWSHINDHIKGNIRYCKGQWGAGKLNACLFSIESDCSNSGFDVPVVGQDVSESDRQLKHI